MIYYADKCGPGDFGIYYDKNYTHFAGYVFIGKEDGHLKISVLTVDEINKANMEEVYPSPPCSDGYDHHKCICCMFPDCWRLTYGEEEKK